jgi:LEA14-like dessication related protein
MNKYISYGVIGLLAYLSLKKAAAAKNFTFLLKGLSISKFPKIEVIIGIQNPSNDRFTIESITGEVSINGKTVGNINSFQKIIIAPNQATLMRIELIPSFFGIGQTIMQMIKKRAKGSLLVNLKGVANMAGIQIPLNVNYTM